MILRESSRGLQTWCKIGICIKSAKKSAEFTAKNANLNQIYMQLFCKITISAIQTTWIHTAGQKIWKSSGKKTREISFWAVFPAQKLNFSHFWNCKKWNLVKKIIVEIDLFDFMSFLAWTFLHILAYCDTYSLILTCKTCKHLSKLKSDYMGLTHESFNKLCCLMNS